MVFVVIEVMPLRGRSVNGDIWRQDVELFRRGNVNYIRTSHYPPDEALLEVCDELGMLIELEAPFCWAHNTKVPEDMHYAVLVNQHIEMVNLNRSHHPLSCGRWETSQICLPNISRKRRKWLSK